jgi:hypothetical protein
MDSNITTSDDKEWTVRKANIEDIPELCKLCYEQFAREQLEDVGHTFSMYTSFYGFEFAIKSDLRIVLVADTGTELVGYFVGAYDTVPYDMTMWMLIEKGWCTRKGWECMGIGWALVQAAEKEATAKGVKHFSLGAPALDWDDRREESYKKRGYTKTEIICYKQVPQGG